VNEKTLEDVIGYDETFFKELITACPNLTDIFDKAEIEKFLKASKNVTAVSTFQIPILSFTSEQVAQIFNFVVRVKIEGFGDTFSGLIIPSQAGKMHLLVNLHSFKEKNFLMPGVPDKMVTLWRASLGEADTRRKKAKIVADPLEITIHRLDPTSISSDKKLFLPIVEKYKLADDDIVYCNELQDALVLFDTNFGLGLQPANVSLQGILITQHVHLCGFSTVTGADSGYNVVPGEVTGVELGKFSISCSSVPGLSGSAVVCDGTGAVIGYCGGALVAKSDKSPFGAYAFPASVVLLGLRKPAVQEHDEQ